MPVPILFNDSVPAVFWIVPLNALVALLPPTVNVGVPAMVLSTVPLPFSPLTVRL